MWMKRLTTIPYLLIENIICERCHFGIIQAFRLNSLASRPSKLYGLTQARNMDKNIPSCWPSFTLPGMHCLLTCVKVSCGLSQTVWDGKGYINTWGQSATASTVMSAYVKQFVRGIKIDYFGFIVSAFNLVNFKVKTIMQRNRNFFFL